MRVPDRRGRRRGCDRPDLRNVPDPGGPWTARHCPPCHAAL